MKTKSIIDALTIFAEQHHYAFIFGSSLENLQTANDLDIAIFNNQEITEDNPIFDFLDDMQDQLEEDMYALAQNSGKTVDTSYAESPNHEGYIGKFIVNPQGEILHDEYDTPFAGKDFFHNATPIKTFLAFLENATKIKE